ncbi:homocysteine S-methyltransferase [alpha proteobacterium BAL199]|jgi:S-methylmethionine-dependent homocysteine/selenocysteine methylase|nr:homocysteine S-methyltransferase [alpha proteobacterium BAL199]
MKSYREHLPQLADRIFLTDGGIETTLIYLEGLDLPYFAAFRLLQDETGRETLRRYYRRHAEIARLNGVGFILESATWRASADWADKVGVSLTALDETNRMAIDLLHGLRAELQTEGSPMVVSGCVGPRGDGYDPGKVMTAAEAQAYHGRQIAVFATAGADMVTAITMTNTPEAVGVALAAKSRGMPVAISFTVETNGRLPTGQPLQDAIAAVDAATGAAPAYYMINCAHPTHFAEQLVAGQPWVSRIRGVRANASRCSHAELDRATELDAGDPVELGALYRDLRARLGHISVLGGCCGTDHRHIEQIAGQCRKAA